jgi:hypothetical protein
MRHGFQEPFEFVDEIIDNAAWVTTQADGATVYIYRASGRGKSYDIVVEGDDGIVSGESVITLKNIRIFIASLHEALAALSHSNVEARPA